MATLVLMRTGESKMDTKTKTENRRLVGWNDVDLSPKGVRQAKVTARRLRDLGLRFDAAFTSGLCRAVRTTWTVLEETGCMATPITPDARLNARHWGALQGAAFRSLSETGRWDEVQRCRDNAAAHPPLQDGLGESQVDVDARVGAAWRQSMAPSIGPDSTLLVVAHEEAVTALARLVGAPDDRPGFADAIVCELDGELRCVRAERMS